MAQLSKKNYDFAGWATCCNKLCSDGRTIRPDAFKHHDGAVVPLVWNHQHNDPTNVLGKALLHSRDGGMYTYCQFNDTEQGNNAKLLVNHGDVVALSIYANELQHDAGRGVTHGMIREVSLVLAGANPGAFIEDVSLGHADGVDGDEAYIYNDDENGIELYHAAEPKEEPKEEPKKEPEKETEPMAEEKKERTLQEIYDGMDEDEKSVCHYLVDQALKENGGADDADNKDNNSEGGNETMKQNAFDQNQVKDGTVLSHAAQEEILAMAKQPGVGSLKAALEMYAQDNADTLAHGFERIGDLFPDYKDVKPGAPELLERDQSWVGLVMRKAHKSPISRIRTRQADARAAELRAKGYTNREVAKSLSGDIKMIMRTFDPQTVYRKDSLHRDDIVDIIDFDVVAYQKNVMRHNLEEDIALAALIGDGREDTDPDKIQEAHIHSIWNDDEIYTIHQDVNVDAMKTKLQGSNTSVNFGEEYIYAEAIIAAALYSREKYKGKGTLDFFCTPHLLNVMLLARDLNGRRIYDSKADLAKALNVGEIHTVEQFEGRTRTTKDGATKKLLGIFVNMANYQFGSTKGGEITSFEDFDIDFNKYIYLMETRLSGALTELYSAIALEEPVTEAAG